jgi:preprotein translocase subunit SecD
MLSKPRPGKFWRLAGAALVAALCLATAYVASAREGAQQSAPAIGAASTGLSMRWVDASEGAASRAGNQRVAAPEGDLWLEPDAIMTGDMIASAATMTDRDGNVVVGFQLTQEGKARFAALTRANIGRRLAILVNGTLVSAPVIRSEIAEGAGQISGRWETAEAEALAAAIAPKRESR